MTTATYYPGTGLGQEQWNPTMQGQPGISPQFAGTPGGIPQYGTFSPYAGGPAFGQLQAQQPFTQQWFGPLSSGQQPYGQQWFGQQVPAAVLPQLIAQQAQALTVIAQLCAQLVSPSAYQMVPPQVAQRLQQPAF